MKFSTSLIESYVYLLVWYYLTVPLYSIHGCYVQWHFRNYSLLVYLICSMWVVYSPSYFTPSHFMFFFQMNCRIVQLQSFSPGILTLWEEFTDWPSSIFPRRSSPQFLLFSGSCDQGWTSGSLTEEGAICLNCVQWHSSSWQGRYDNRNMRWLAVLWSQAGSQVDEEWASTIAVSQGLPYWPTSSHSAPLSQWFCNLLK